ncbi:hypothetical protein [Blautia sp.]|uniref:hypothetical protein n=1 Tax=Blautia sp. TaxID=1955243 RepID=UPI003AB8EC97
MTKKQSKMMYGVAIVLMLYHHVFGVPEMLGCDYYSVLGWNIRGGKHLNSSLRGLEKYV